MSADKNGVPTSKNKVDVWVKWINETADANAVTHAFKEMAGENLALAKEVYARFSNKPMSKRVLNEMRDSLKEHGAKPKKREHRDRQGRPMHLLRAAV